MGNFKIIHLAVLAFITGHLVTGHGSSPCVLVATLVFEWPLEPRPCRADGSKLWYLTLPPWLLETLILSHNPPDIRNCSDPRGLDHEIQLKEHRTAVAFIVGLPCSLRLSHSHLTRWARVHARTMPKTHRSCGSSPTRPRSLRFGQNEWPLGRSFVLACFPSDYKRWMGSVFISKHPRPEQTCPTQTSQT